MSDFNSINDEEMLAAVLEMSRQDAGLSCHAPEDEPTSSPDTGLGDADAQEMNYRPDLLETDTKPSAGNHQSQKHRHTSQEGQGGVGLNSSLKLFFETTHQNSSL